MTVETLTTNATKRCERLFLAFVLWVRRVMGINGAPGAAAPPPYPHAAEVRAVAATLLKTFLQFGIDAKPTAQHRGPAVTLYEIELGAGVPVDKVLKVAKNIRLALGTPAIRIVEVIPGKPRMGIEVPNKKRETVALADVLANAPDPVPGTLIVGLGADVMGRPVHVDLAKLPHILIAGVTGSGKSVTLNDILCSLVGRYTPDDVRLILIDPKRVELAMYRGVGHLLTPIVTDARRAIDALEWAVEEMDRRYDLLAAAGARNIDEYNRRAPAAARLARLVIAIDEWADLMILAESRVGNTRENPAEDAVRRLGGLARAAGIHLVVATQRPSSDVVTGVIAANIPARVAHAVTSMVNSRVILDQNGAETLLGKGDGLYLAPDAGAPVRFQGAYIDDDEIAEVVEYARTLRPSDRDAEEIIFERAPRALTSASESTGDDQVSGDARSDFRQARELVVAADFGSTSMLQRKMRIGFAKAGALMDELEAAGVVGPSNGTRPREVLISISDLAEIEGRERDAGD